MINFLMTLGLLIFIVGTIGCLATTIVMAVKKKKKPWIPAIGIPIFLIVGFIILMIGSSLYSQTDEYKESMKEREVEEQKRAEEEQERLETERQQREEEEQKKQQEDESKKEDIAEKESKKEEKESQDTEKNKTEQEKKNISTIFYGEIGLNEDEYKGKEVAFSFRCEYVYNEDRIETESNLCYGGVNVFFEEPQDIEEGDYITVSGVIGEKYSATALNDAVIICKGEEAKRNYEREMEEFKQSFLEAESVSYEDLLRYPDTYKNQKVKIELSITDVESDGVIFNGTIKSVVTGTQNEVALYDYRENREPRIQEGDNLIVYGVGNRTVTVKVKDGKGLFAEILDEYEVPCLYIQYIELR